MELVKPKINSVLKYHGGKSYLAKYIIPLLPDKTFFFDATVGAGNIILNTKPDPRRADYAIDIDPDIIKMWKTIQVYYDEVLELLKSVDYSERTFLAASKILDHNIGKDDIFWCANYIIRNRMSRGGLGKTFAWSERLRGGKPGDVNAWENFLNVHYPRVVERIQTIVFIHGCIRDKLEAYGILDNPDAVVYIDPPYISSSRTINKIYKHEMLTKDEDTTDPTKVLTHEGMWAMIRCAKCKFYVSGYYSKEYEDFGAKVIFKKDVANHSGQNKIKNRRIELVYS